MHELVYLKTFTSIFVYEFSVNHGFTVMVGIYQIYCSCSDRLDILEKLARRTLQVDAYCPRPFHQIHAFSSAQSQEGCQIEEAA